MGHRHHDHLRSDAGTSEPSQADARAAKTGEANAEREKVLTTLRPYSAAWWAIHDEIEADSDRRLNRKLVICRGCLIPPPTEDQTGSIPGK